MGFEKIDNETFENMLDDLILADEFVSHFKLDERKKKLFKKTRFMFEQKKVVDSDIYKLLGELQSKYLLGIVSNYSSNLLKYLDELI